MTVQVRAIAKRLNDQHAKYSAGFYGSHPQVRGRYFQARVNKKNGELEVGDFETWVPVPYGAEFHDHNGRKFLTVV